MKVRHPETQSFELTTDNLVVKRTLRLLRGCSRKRASCGYRIMICRM